MAASRDEKTDEDGARAPEVGREVQGVRRERRIPVPARGAPRDPGAACVDRDHEADRGEDPPRQVELRGGVSRQPANGDDADRDARRAQHRRFGERREVLALPWP